MSQEARKEQAGKPQAYPQSGVAHTCRSYREYMDMFGLDEELLRSGPVLDVAGGASSFTAQLRDMGITAVAADPLYGKPAEAVLSEARKEIEVSSAKIAAAAASYDWSYYGSPERHRRLREASFERFAADFVREDAAERYVAASLPKLPFADGTFALAVCSHFLFLYADQFGETFHRDALSELLRVVRPGGEIRVYPLVSLKWETSPFLPAVVTDLEALADVRTVPSKLPFTPVASEVLAAVRKR